MSADSEVTKSADVPIQTVSHSMPSHTRQHNIHATRWLCLTDPQLLQNITAATHSLRLLLDANFDFSHSYKHTKHVPHYFTVSVLYKVLTYLFACFTIDYVQRNNFWEVL